MLGLPKNVYLIAIVMSLSFALTSMMVLVGGILGSELAPNPQYATLPTALLIVGTASAAIPAAMIMQRFGRKTGMYCGLVLALLGTALCFIGAMHSSFGFFVAGSVCIGFNAAFTQQGRFIILENALNEKQQADGLTLALMANLAAAIIGPWIGTQGKDLISSPVGFAGCFVLGALLLFFAMLVLTQFKNVPIEVDKLKPLGRPISVIARQPIFILSAGSAAIGYGVMALVMTATPLSMFQVSGHSLESTGLVIQSHIVAMFLPSLLSGFLIKRGWKMSLLFSAMALYLIVSVVGFSGDSVPHYWWALVALGLGWNFLFLTSTAILPHSYNSTERFKVQALNDFLMFTVQAIAAFAAGWLLFNSGWHSVLWIASGLTLFWLLSLTFLTGALPKPVSNSQPTH